jgi:(E)-4-hydroxy-3-methylbut-2-enyl-diphosphate synthase
MGCIVNGPGEARKADFGIAGGDGEGVIFAHGRPVRKVPQEELVDRLFEEIAAAQGRERALDGGGEAGHSDGADRADRAVGR